MTEKMRKEVARIKAIRKDLESKRHAILDIPVDAISEEEEDRLFKTYSDQIEITISAEYDAMLPNFRPNDWFKSFISSFEDCESKRITKKQAEIFARYLPFAEQKHSFSSFHGKSFVVGSECAGKYQGKVYKASLYSDCGYITIRPVITVSLVGV